MSQLYFSEALRVSTTHGGEFSRGKRKTARPIATRRPMHLVVRSSRAKGDKSFLHPRHARFIKDLVVQLAGENFLRVYRYANVGNHLHLLVRAKNRRGFQRFVRILTGRIAMRVAGTKKGNPSKGRFWDLLPFTRIMEWGRAYWNACRYVELNELEGLGLVRRLSKKSPRGRPPPQ